MAEQTISITLNGEKKEVAADQTGVQLFSDDKNIIAVRLNGEPRDLYTELHDGDVVEPIALDSEDGVAIMRHSATHVMAQAVQEIRPDAKLGVGPVIKDGFYYDFDVETPFTPEDLKEIEKRMQRIIKSSQSFRRRVVTEEEALAEEADQPYKLELIKDKEAHLDPEAATEISGKELSFYDNVDREGNVVWKDLCRGPHLPNTSYLKAVKIMSVAGAYWRGDEKRKQLVRLYGITFPKKKMLDEYLALMEEAKKRDHRKIGKELELFTFSTAVGAGLPLWLPRGTQLRLKLEDFLKRIQKKYGYQQVMTPHIGGKQLYVTSGHYAKYGKDSFQPIHTPQEGEEFLLKPMNCPHHCEIFKSFPRSYKDLPLRFAEFGTVYRYEQSGELHGLTRVRGFTQDDAHLFCRPDQLKDEFLKVMDIIFIIFKALDFENFEAQISLRDKVNRDKYIGSEENWEKAESAIIEACQEKGLKAKIEYGEAAFYGPKLDFMVKDAIGRRWQLGTIQVDYNLPERFELEYTGEDNKKHRPVMIHRAPFGSMERFVAVLIEHTGGKFPLWLTPDQVAILPISEKFNDYAYEVKRQLEAEDLSVLVDDRNEKIGRKIRDTELKRIPYMLIVGEKEAENNEVSVRKQGEGDKGSMKITTFAALLKGEVEDQMNHWKKDNN